MGDEEFVEEALTEDGMAYLIGRALANANEAFAKSLENKSDLFAAGRANAYRKALDILQSELGVSERYLENCGLDMNVARDYIG